MTQDLRGCASPQVPLSYSDGSDMHACPKAPWPFLHRIYAMWCSASPFIGCGAARMPHTLTPPTDEAIKRHQAIAPSVRGRGVWAIQPSPHLGSSSCSAANKYRSTPKPSTSTKSSGAPKRASDPRQKATAVAVDQVIKDRAQTFIAITGMTQKGRRAQGILMRVKHRIMLSSRKKGSRPKNPRPIP
jgi:hypothetical protein